MTIENNNEYFSKIFKNLDSAGESFTEVIFENCIFEHCNFSDTRFYKCKFVDCVFANTNLSNCKVDYSKFFDIGFNSSKLVGIDWTKADWPRFNFISPLKFNNCIINDCSFFGLALGELVLEHCKAHDVDFRNGNFNKAIFCYTDFTNSLFMKTNLQGADFSEAENYDIDIFNNEIKAARFSRMEAVRLLNSLDIELVD
jgi:fluoroquinolone resistance protein